MSIHIEDLTVRFKNGVTAINHANLNIPNGIFGLLGENGAGKTTLMRVLTTVLKPTSGTVTLDRILYSEGNYEKIQRKIGYLPQEIDLYPNLTVQECLEYMGDLAGVPKAECKKRIEYYLKKTSLAEHRKKKMKQLSGGMKRRVGLVQALLNEPEFLIVDEPTTGLDPEERIRIRNLLVDFSENRTVLFSTHVVEDLAATCNQLALAFQAFLMMVCVAIYAVLVAGIQYSDNLSSSLFGVMAYTVILCYSLFKTASLSKSIFNAH